MTLEEYNAYTHILSLLIRKNLMVTLLKEYTETSKDLCSTEEK